MADSHLGSCSACFTVLGSVCVKRSLGLILGRTIPDLALVCIGHR
ncbi:hypothetical protein A2U01_0067603, partial [Trifolium medium]|nr:hypothetical protein [Trifolium medium]